MLFHTSLGPLFTRSTFSVSLSISLCTESNFEQGAVCTESSLGYIEMQRDCIIGWKDNSKLDDPNRFVMVFFFPFRGYQTREVAGTRNTVLHIILIRRDTFIYIYIYKNWQEGIFYFYIFQNRSDPKSYSTRKKKTHTVRTTSSVATSQKHPACRSIVCRIQISPLPPPP